MKLPLISKGGCTHWRKIKYFYKQKGLASNFTCVHWKYKHHIFEFGVSSVWWVKRSILHCTNRFYCHMFSYLELFLMYIFLCHIFLGASVLSGFLINFSLSFVYDALYCSVFTLFLFNEFTYSILSCNVFYNTFKGGSLLHLAKPVLNFP